MTHIHQLYHEAVRADADYHDALVAEYGSKAVEVRYSMNKQLPPVIAALRLAKLTADENYLSACRALRS